MKLKLGVHWFRQDLRLLNNPSLEHLSDKADKIIPIYIFDNNQRIGSVSKWWLEQSLKALSNQISNYKGNFNIYVGNPEDIILSIISNKNIKYFSWNRLYDPYSINRDKKIKSLLQSNDIDCDTFNGFLLNEPWNIKNKSGSFFKVFTPYWRNCDQIIKNKNLDNKKYKIKFLNKTNKNTKKIDDLKLTNKQMKWTNKIKNNWLPGEDNAQLNLKEFI